MLAGTEEGAKPSLRAHPARSMNSRKMESNPGDFPGFRRLRATASSSSQKGSEIL